MKSPLAHSSGQYPSPEVMVRKLRRGYWLPFSMVILPLGSALTTVWLHEWQNALTSASFSLMFLPIALYNYRNEKAICERTILKYEKWYAENKPQSKLD